MSIGTVRKLRPDDPDSPWVYTYTDPDTKKRVQVTPKDGKKKSAQAIQAEVTARIVSGTHVALVNTRTVGEAMTSYVEHCEARHKRGHRMTGETLAKVKTFSRTVVPLWLKNKPLTEARRIDFQKALDEQSDRLAPITIRTVSPFYSQIIKHAVSNGWLKVNFLRENPLHLPEVTKKRGVPSKVDLRSLLEVLAERRKGEVAHTYMMRVAIVALALFAGLRRGEIAGLQWENIDFVEGTIEVRHSLSTHDGLKGTKTKAGVRDVPMAPQVRLILEHIISQARDNLHGFVLTARPDRKNPLCVNAMGQNHWAPVMRAAGLVEPDGKRKFTLHQLRHAAISLLIEQGLDPMQIKVIAGHSSIQMTMDVYGHLFPEDTRARHAIMAASSQFTLTAERRPTRTDRRAARQAGQIGATKTRHAVLALS